MAANRFLHHLGILHLGLLLPVLACGADSPVVDPLADPPQPAFAGQTAAPAPAVTVRVEPRVIATGLQAPRALVALPDGNLLVAEGVGTMRILSERGELSEPLAGMPPILSVGGRSLHDVALDHDFENSRRLYLTWLAPAPGEKAGARSAEERTRATSGGRSFQVPQLASARLSDDLSRLENVTLLADVWGRRLLSAPDGTLYVSTMAFDDAFNDQRQLAQNIASVRGKFLRFNADGTIPSDNPFANRPAMRQEIFSLGHRDPDGMAINPATGELWAIEHGPMGGDELNIIRGGNNYGWPLVTYGKNYDGSRIGYTSRFGMEQPRYYWYPSVAPSGLLFYTGDVVPQWQGNLFLGTMSPTQGRYLVRLVLDGDKVVGEEHLLVEHDRRVRDLTQGADGALYVLTDSEDNEATGRHFPGEVLRLEPGVD